MIDHGGPSPSRTDRTRTEPETERGTTALAIFGKKKSSAEETGKASSTEQATPDAPADARKDKGKTPELLYHPDKANRFFEHARTSHEATNYEYAMQLWLKGLQFDPQNMQALEGFFKSAAAFLNSQDTKKPKGPSRETVKAIETIDAPADLRRYLVSLLQWAVRPTDAVLAVRATENAARLDLGEPGYWLGVRAMAAASRETKPRKDLFVKLMDAFTRIGAYEQAVEAGEAGLRVDPTDASLSASVKNLAAQATMASGGYDTTGEAGGFRKNIRDAERQKQLDEAERISKTEDAIDRLVKAAAEKYKESPDDNVVVLNYAKRLLERGRPEDEEHAWKALDRAYQRTREFRFRKMAGEIMLRRARRKLNEYRDAAQENPDDRHKQEAYRAAQAKFLDMEIKELAAWEEAYPTDLSIKFELGKRYFDARRYEDAIEMFQKSQGDAKVRIASLHHLAQSFLQIAWLDEAVETYRKTIDAHRTTDDELGMELRYGLMTALQTKAEMRRDLEAAMEAEKLASSIAIQQISYRDIRQRREELKQLIADLSKGDAA